MSVLLAHCMVTSWLINVSVMQYPARVWSAVQLFSLSLVVATLYYGGHLVMNNLMSAGDLVAFVLYQMELGFALEVLLI